MVVDDVVPPHPGAAGGVGDAVHAELPEVLHHHVLAVVAGAQVALRVRRAVAAAVDALRLALRRLQERVGAEPGDVVRGEERVAALLQQLRVAPERAHERRLLVAPGPALVVAVGPELVLHPLVGVRHRLAPVQPHHHLLLLVAVGRREAEGVAELLGHQRGWHRDVGEERHVGGLLLGAVHRQQRLVGAVRHQHGRRAGELRVPRLEREVAAPAVHEEDHGTARRGPQLLAAERLAGRGQLRVRVQHHARQRAAVVGDPVVGDRGLVVAAQRARGQHLDAVLLHDEPC